VCLYMSMLHACVCMCVCSMHDDNALFENGQGVGVCVYVCVYVCFCMCLFHMCVCMCVRSMHDAMHSLKMSNVCVHVYM